MYYLGFSPILRVSCLAIIAIGSVSCADWRAYEWAEPPHLEIVPLPKLEELSKDAIKNPEDKEFFRPRGWRKEYSEKIHHLFGWKPNFCSLVEAKKHTRNKILEDIDASNLELFRSYMRTIHGGFKPEEKAKPPYDKIEVEQVRKCTDKEDVQGQLMTEEYFDILLRNKLFKRIDTDHQRLVRDPKGPMLQCYKGATCEQLNGRNLTLSILKPAALTISTRKMNGREPQKPPLFALSETGQAALINLVKEDVLSDESSKGKCRGANQGADCESIKGVTKDLLGMLVGVPKSTGKVKDFDPKQTIELRVSSVVNSPDTVDRFDYIATYLYIYPYPLPTNQPVNLAEEFWERFMSKHLARPTEQRKVNLAADLDGVWQDLRVTIHTVETTVTTSAILEIAEITRKGTAEAALKEVKPSVELLGTVNGSVEAQGSLGSQIETTVREKIVKQLDQRSIWIGSSRDQLRVTQRGSEAINVAGTITEKVTLNIPTSFRPVTLVEIADGKLRISKTLSQPLYSRVHALGISFAVVREPYGFKRSASEKFGLPDAADARLVAQISNPIYLHLWNWDRRLDIVTFEELTGILPSVPQPKSKTTNQLMFYVPATNEQGPLIIDPKESETFRLELKTAIMNFRDKVKAAECGKGSDGEKENKKLKSKLCISVKNDSNKPSKKESFYLVANSHMPPLEWIWIGKSKSGDGEIVPFNCGEIPYLSQHLIEKGLCRKGP